MWVSREGILYIETRCTEVNKKGCVGQMHIRKSKGVRVRKVASRKQWGNTLVTCGCKASSAKIRISTGNQGQKEGRCTHPLQYSLELVGIHERYRHQEHAAYGSEV